MASSPKLSEDEVSRVDRLQRQGKTPKEILVTIQKSRLRKGLSGPGKSAIYSFLNGETHPRGAEESRGRKSKLRHDLVSVAFSQRRKLIKEAKNEWLVTWEDVHKATKNELKKRGRFNRCVKMPCADWLARQVRAHTAVRARPPKRRIGRKLEHKQKRWSQGLKWQRYSKQATATDSWLHHNPCPTALLTDN